MEELVDELLADMAEVGDAGPFNSTLQSPHPLAVSAGWSNNDPLVESPRHLVVARKGVEVENEVRTIDLSMQQPQARFDLHGELFHVFISYRVKTEGRKEGNGFASKLYKQLHMLSNGDDELNIPPMGCGRYPRFAMEPPAGIARKHHVAKVYLDEYCLTNGDKWMEGFVKGLSISMVAVLLLSWTEHGEGPEGMWGSVGGLFRLTEESDQVDNVLLEWIIALELKMHPEGSIKSIIPVFIGHPKILEAFPYEKRNDLPDIVAKKTNNTAAEILRKLGVAGEQIEAMKTKTVKDIFGEVLAHQGIKLNHLADETEAITDCAKQIIRSCQRGISVIHSDPRTFVSIRPMGQEVMEWLQDNVLETYAPVLAINGLDNLFAVSNLKDDEIRKLSAEHAAMYCQKSIKPLMGNTGDLQRAIVLLKSDDRAKLLDYRLDNFNDPKVSALGMLTSSNSMEILSSKLGGQLVLVSVGFSGFALSVQFLYEVFQLTPGYTLVTGVDHPESGIMRVDYIVCFIGCLIFCIVGVITLYLAVYQHISPRQLIKTLFKAAMFLALATFIGGVSSFFQCSYNDDVKAAGTLGECQNFAWFFVYSLWPVFMGVVIKYRQEYVARAYMILQVACSLYWWSLDDFSWQIGAPTFNFAAICICCTAFASLQIGVFGAIQKANELTQFDVMEYREKWNEITSEPKNTKALQTLAQTVTEKVSLVLDDEYKNHFKKVSWLDLLLFLLRCKDDKFVSKKPFKKCRSYKVRQVNKNLDILFCHAALINVPFHNLVDDICRVTESRLATEQIRLPSRDVYRVGDVDTDTEKRPVLKRGPVKMPERAIEKVVRSYRRDPASLTDLVRCTVTVDSCNDLLNYVQRILDMSVVGTGSLDDVKDSEKPTKMFRLVGVKNRFRLDYDERLSAGYRSMSINVEVGWEMEQGGVVFKPVSEWGNVRRHICEVQVHLKGFNGDESPDKRRNYVAWRNTQNR